MMKIDCSPGKCEGEQWKAGRWGGKRRITPDDPNVQKISKISLNSPKEKPQKKVESLAARIEFASRMTWRPASPHGRP